MLINVPFLCSSGCLCSLLKGGSGFPRVIYFFRKSICVQLEFFLRMITFRLLDAVSCTLISFLFSCLFFANITWFYHREARRKPDDMLCSLWGDRKIGVQWPPPADCDRTTGLAAGLMRTVSCLWARSQQWSLCFGQFLTVSVLWYPKAERCHWGIN